jgi:DNA-binding NarL/FixJ family response regulator
MGETSEAVGLLLSDDLLFTSRITGTAGALGLSIKAARTVDALLGLAGQHQPRCVIVDLAVPGLVLAELFRQLGDNRPRVVAYGSHVDVETLRAARAAGCDPVMPRSQFVEVLASALGGWFARPENS